MANRYVNSPLHNEFRVVLRSVDQAPDKDGPPGITTRLIRPIVMPKYIYHLWPPDGKYLNTVHQRLKINPADHINA